MKDFMKWLLVFLNFMVIYFMGVLTVLFEPTILLFVLSLISVLCYTGIVEGTHKLLEHYQKESQTYWSWVKEDEKTIKVLREKLSEK